jgi:hypothetical protein
MTKEKNPTDPDVLRALQAALEDGRQSDDALAIARGVGRMVRRLGHAHISELSLGNRRRSAHPNRRPLDYRNQIQRR